MDRVCKGIPGDANLYTLFRIQGNPIDCPFGTDHGFKFSYDKGKGDCEWPESELEPCTDTKRLVLNYQACPNVQGSELMSMCSKQSSLKKGTLQRTSNFENFKCINSLHIRPVNSNSPMTAEISCRVVG